MKYQHVRFLLSNYHQTKGSKLNIEHPGNPASGSVKRKRDQRVVWNMSLEHACSRLTKTVSSDCFFGNGLEQNNKYKEINVKLTSLF